MLTRIFRSGNSLAVRIPKELAFMDAAQDVEMERVGDTLVLRLAGQDTMADIGDVLALFSPGFMAAGRDPAPEQERDWYATTPLPALMAAEEQATYRVAVPSAAKGKPTATRRASARRAAPPKRA